MLRLFSKRIVGATKLCVPFRTSFVRPYIQSLKHEFRIVEHQRPSLFKRLLTYRKFIAKPVFYYGGLLAVSGLCYVKYHKFGKMETVSKGTELHDLVVKMCVKGSASNFYKRYSAGSYEHKRLHNILQTLIEPAKLVVKAHELLMQRVIIASKPNLVIISSDDIYSTADHNTNTILISSECLNTLTEDEIAFLLAHELSHLFLLNAKSRVDVLTDALETVDMTVVERSGLELSHSDIRDMADDFDVILTGSAGYDVVKAAPNFLLKLHEQYLRRQFKRKYRSKRFNSHPYTLERYARMYGLVIQLTDMPPSLRSNTRNHLSVFSDWLGLSVSLMLYDYMRYTERKR